MRTISTLGLLVITAAAFAQTPPTPAQKVPADQSPIVQRINPNRPDITLEQAEKDIQNNRFRFFSYGLVRMQHYEIGRVLQKEYGIVHETAAGCVVSGSLVARVRAYNERMEKAVLKKYGKTYSELYEEVRAKLPPKQPAPAATQNS